MGLGAWASSKTDPRARALSRLGELRASNRHKGAVEHLMPLTDREQYLASLPSDLNERIEEAPIVSVPLARLQAIQHTVQPARVAAHVEDPGLVGTGARDSRHGGLVDYPIVVKKGGALYLHDGHHRATASFLEGCEEMDARLVDLDAG